MWSRSFVLFAAMLFSCAALSAEDLVRVRVTRGEGATAIKYDLTITLTELKKLRAESDVVSIQMLGAPNAHQPNVESSDWSSGTYVYDAPGTSRRSARTAISMILSTVWSALP